MNLKWFSESEFARCVPPCKMSECSEQALKKLDDLRDFCGFPIVVNSAFRSKSYEKKNGRTGTSSHCKGVAFDLRCYDSKLRAIMVRNAFRVGFNRIGISDSFIHVDCDSDKLNPCIWLY